MSNKVNIQELLAKAGLDEPLYPGKRVVKKLPQQGQFKSHCVVYDWRDPKKIRVEVKAGLTGRDLPKKELAQYPISLQTPTFVDIAVQG
jgi:hypothetical protein